MVGRMELGISVKNFRRPSESDADQVVEQQADDTKAGGGWERNRRENATERDGFFITSLSLRIYKMRSRIFFATSSRCQYTVCAPMYFLPEQITGSF